MPDPAPRRSRPRPARRVAGVLPRRRRTDDVADRTRPAEPPTEPAPAAAEHVPAPTGWQRIWRALAHPGRGQVIAAVLLFVVGLGGVMQLRINSAGDAYANARREDLIQILDGLGAESERLEQEITELQQTRSELVSGADSSKVAREETERRLEQLAILAGTAPAEGPGITIRISDPAGKLRADVLLDAVEEMRDAGAEVIEINQRVRVVASTWFADQNGQLVADGVTLQRPVTLTVIGDPHSLEEAARFRGGLVSEITGPRIGGTAEIEQHEKLEVSSLHTTRPTQYAQPSSTAPTPR